MLRPLWTALSQWAWPDVTGVFLLARHVVQQETWEGRVAFTFEDEYRNDPVFLTKLRHAIFAIDDEPPGRRRDQDQVREWMNDPLFAEPDYRRALPTSVTNGVQVYFADVSVPSKHLVVDFDPSDIDHGLVPCRAEPGDEGRIVVRRYWAEAVRQRHMARVQAVSERGVPVTGVLIQANFRLFKPGSDDYPCLVLISFEADPADLEPLAHRLHDLKSAEPSSDMERRVARWLIDETCRYHRRRRLPDGFTGGLPPVYVADLWIHRPFLPHGYITDRDRWLPCVAEPGDQGGIELLPAGE